MIVTYLGHSGFLVETGKNYLLFDSIAADELTPRMLAHPFSHGIMPELDPAKEVLVFVSHAHPDHFSRRIWDLRNRYPHVKYFLSSDIDMAPLYEAGYVQGPDDADVFILDPGQSYHPVLSSGCNLLIETLPSTDEGIAFFLTLDGVTIYHAGDLHAWCWDPVPEGQDDEGSIVVEPVAPAEEKYSPKEEERTEYVMTDDAEHVSAVQLETAVLESPVRPYMNVDPSEVESLGMRIKERADVEVYVESEPTQDATISDVFVDKEPEEKVDVDDFVYSTKPVEDNKGDYDASVRNVTFDGKDAELRTLADVSPTYSSEHDKVKGDFRVVDGRRKKTVLETPFDNEEGVDYVQVDPDADLIDADGGWSNVLSAMKESGDDGSDDSFSDYMSDDYEESEDEDFSEDDESDFEEEYEDDESEEEDDEEYDGEEYGDEEEE